MIDGEIINDRFKIIENIGSGGMSEIFLARDLTFNQLVVVKVLLEEASKKIDNVIRFHNEVKIAKTINHPNIIRYISNGKYNDQPYIVYEYIKSDTLRTDLFYKRYYSSLEASLIMVQICDAIIYLHNNKIIHRDIKPNNIFYSKTGEIKLSDFGISMFYGGTMNINENKKVMGTPQYMSPELITGRKSTYQSDIYSLGIIYFELISGRCPFNGENYKEIVYKQVKEDFPSILSIMPNTPKDIAKIIEKACEKKPSKRYKTVLDMKIDILKVLDNKKELKKSQSFFNRIFGIRRSSL